MMKFALLALIIALPFPEAQGKEKLTVDSLLAKVGREAILLSDLQRFVEVDKVLLCSGVIHREKELPTDTRLLLEAYIEEELMYQEARSKKIPTVGMIPQTVRTIHSKEKCKANWQRLGEKFGKYWKSEGRVREGQSQLVREVERRMLVDKFRKSELIADGEVWKREAKTRYPVKIYLE